MPGNGLVIRMQTHSQQLRTSRKRKSALEESLLSQLLYAGVAAEREFKFHPERKWRLDFAWPEKRIGVECEGGIWTNGAHTRGAHFTSDCEKYNAAALLGWRVFRFTTDMIKNGTAIKTITEALQ